MTPIHPHDYIQNYEAGIASLKVNPFDRDLQHTVVLALARAGALDFAMCEYNRYGLADVRGHEDIMALNGRLSKDLYLRSSGKKAIKHAGDAARKYEAAFQDTLGYYSGINSATMALMADMPAERVSARVEAIEALLPVSRDVTPTDHYFTEATRAECFLLKGERSKAASALQAAIGFDPLNYTAHATTLKQFMMISAKRGEGVDWLSDFRPPRPLHFAGHIRLKQSGIDQDALEVSISDALQYQDVGFGFGALAAGGDIIFAENLLEQGADLHVILPCPRDIFKRESVTPFGETWGQRFEDCMAQASSVRILTQSDQWPDKTVNRLSGLSAMGHAVMQGRALSVDPLQMLILNDETSLSYTATHAQDWAVTGYAQFRFSEDGLHPFNDRGPDADSEIACALKAEASSPKVYPDVMTAVKAAFTLRAAQDETKVALHLKIEREPTEAILNQVLGGAAPHSLLATEAFASVFAAKAKGRYKITYAGQVTSGGETPIRCYSIQKAAVLTDTLS